MTENRLLDADPTFESAVARLTKPWTDVLTPRETGLGKYVPIDFPPLLQMLADACVSGIGGTPTSGRTDPASRNLLNLEALSIREHIDGTVRAWIGQLSRQRPEAELEAAMLQFVGILQAHHAAATITDREYERLTAHFPRWCNRIWALYDPPHVKELNGACPACEHTEYEAIDGSKTTAMIAYYWRGIRPEAKCQWCGEHWSGERALLDLGYHIGATVDEDALREMGVI